MAKKSRRDADLRKAVLGRRLKNPVELVIAGEPYEMSEVGAAERFTALWYGHAVWCVEQQIWLVWSGKRWEASNERAKELAMRTARSVRNEVLECGSDALAKALFKFALRCESASTISAMLRLAQGFDGMWALAERFDSDPWLLNVSNGVIDLRSGKLLDHAPDLMMRKISRCAYEPGFRSEMWEGFIRDATHGDAELVAYMQRACGYALTGLTSEKCLFFVFSTAGNTGKSCLLAALQSVLGEYAVSINIEVFSQDSRDKYDLAKLQGARLAALSEIDEGKRLGSSLLKRVTGDDRIRARDCGEKSMEFKPQFKIWMVANHAPLLPSNDQALWNRVRRIPFNHEVPSEKRDTKIIQAANEPVSDFCKAFLAWAVEGCLEWQKMGQLGSAAVIDESTAAYRDEMNPLGEFFSECCRVAADARSGARALYEAYLAWAKSINMKTAMVMNMKTFRARVETNGFPYQRKESGMVVSGVEPLAKDGLGLSEEPVDEAASPPSWEEIF